MNESESLAVPTIAPIKVWPRQLVAPWALPHRITDEEVAALEAAAYTVIPYPDHEWGLWCFRLTDCRDRFGQPYIPVEA